jgi:DNA polymerase III alpha subunit
MNNIIPIFYDHSSYKSILTFDDEIENGPDNILEICKSNNIKQCYFASNNFHTFLTAWKAAKKKGIQLIFGLEIWMCNDSKVHDEQSPKSNNKIIVFQKNSDGYTDLIKLYTALHTNIENKYHKYRLDYQQLKKYWTDNLILTIPFFDSFVAKNLLQFESSIVPDFPIKPVIMREVDSGLPFDILIGKALDEFNKNKEYEEIKVKTIFYKDRKDVPAWIVYRSIGLHSNFSAPEMDYCCSNNFCFESFKELTQTT